MPCPSHESDVNDTKEEHMNRKWIAGAATLAVMACSGMSIQAVGAQAQSTTQPGTMKGPEVEGRVRDVRGNQVTLNDGTTLTVPKNQAKLEELKAGSKIKATYEERDGQKIVTSLRITEGPQAGSTK
jgi:Cu/Ag efflux protein CusF